MSNPNKIIPIDVNPQSKLIQMMTIPNKIIPTDANPQSKLIQMMTIPNKIIPTDANPNQNSYYKSKVERVAFHFLHPFCLSPLENPCKMMPTCNILNPLWPN